MRNIIKEKGVFLRGHMIWSLRPVPFLQVDVQGGAVVGRFAVSAFFELAHFHVKTLQLYNRLEYTTDLNSNH